MKYSHVNDLSKDSEPSNIDWQNLALKPFIYGALYGAGYYAVKLFLKSPLGFEFLKLAQENANK